MTLWCVNIHGPDDVVAVADYLTAIKVANAFNAWWQRQEIRANDPHMWAVPIAWPYTEASHAESVADTAGEYAGFIAAALASSEVIEWTPELEAARIALCHFWLKIADDPRKAALAIPNSAAGPSRRNRRSPYWATTAVSPPSEADHGQAQAVVISLDQISQRGSSKGTSPQKGPNSNHEILHHQPGPQPRQDAADG